MNGESNSVEQINDNDSNRISKSLIDSGQEIELLNSLDKKGLGSDWYSGNIITLVEWLNIASLYILILDKQITFYRKILNKITIMGLVLSTITSTISLSQLSLDEKEFPNLSLGLKICFSFTSIFTTIATGSLKIMNIQNHLDTCIEYYQQWNAFAAEISGQLQLPIAIRKNALSIIIRLKSSFKRLFTTRLPLTNSIKQSASNLIENKTYVETRYKDDRGNLLVKRGCGVMMFRCISNKRDRKIHNYFSNRLSVYYMYQDIIISELDSLIKELNKQNTARKVGYRIEPTKIVVEDIIDKHSDLIKSSDSYDNISKQDVINYRETKPLSCSINPNIDMNVSVMSNTSLTTNKTVASNLDKNIIGDSNLADAGGDLAELENALNPNNVSIQIVDSSFNNTS